MITVIGSLIGFVTGMVSGAWAYRVGFRDGRRK